MLSPGHLKDLQKAGLTAAETQFFFNTRKTIFNMGSNGKGLTSSQVAATHTLYPNAGVCDLVIDEGDFAGRGRR